VGDKIDVTIENAPVRLALNSARTVVPSRTSFPDCRGAKFAPTTVIRPPRVVLDGLTVSAGEAAWAITMGMISMSGSTIIGSVATMFASREGRVGDAPWRWVEGFGVRAANGIAL